VHELFNTTDAEGLPVVFLSMQLLEGETLAQRLARAGAFPADEALPLLRDIANALQAAHQQEIVHGDLKPGNIMLVRSKDGKLRAIVTDFGLARRQAESSTDSGFGDPFGGGGTPAYMSPEQLEGGVATPATDIYALGLVAFEMVTAARPFQEAAEWAEQSRRLTEPAPQPTKLAPHLPDVWDANIARCLHRDPSARFASPSDFIDAFNPVVLPEPKVVSRPWVGGIAAAAVVLAGGWAWWSQEPLGGVELPPRSVAIAPFENASGNPEEQYYSDAMTDEIAQTVADLPGVTVIGRESSFRIKRGGVGAAEIGKQLRVRYVLTGTVSRTGERFSIHAQLVDAASGSQVFSEDYAGEVQRTPEVKDHIAKAIGNALSVNLAGMQAPKMLDSMQMRANELYWLGRFQWRKRSDDSVRASLEYFRKAIAEDPRHALAYTGLADAICVLAERGIIQAGAGLAEAKQAALAAIAINDKLAEGYVSLAHVVSLLDYDLQTAEGHFRRALQLDPTLASAHHWYSYMLVKQRRFKEAQQHALQALELEPLSLPVNINVAVQHYYAEDDDRTVQQCRKLSQLEPELIFNHLLIAQVFARKGLASEAINEMGQIRPDQKDHPLVHRYWAELYALVGKREQAREYIDRLVAAHPAGGVPSSYIAAAYASIGDGNNAFAWLERAFKEHDAFMPMIDVYPSFALIRTDSRYEPLLHKLGLKPGMATDSARAR
jgi:serine/threonine-protein kinase